MIQVGVQDTLCVEKLGFIAWVLENIVWEDVGIPFKEEMVDPLVGVGVPLMIIMLQQVERLRTYYINMFGISFGFCFRSILDLSCQQSLATQVHRRILL